jgi:hypothetical protein
MSADFGRQQSTRDSSRQAVYRQLMVSGIALSDFSPGTGVNSCQLRPSREARPDTSSLGILGGNWWVSGRFPLRSLELDGYTYRDGRLLRPEEDALEIQESKGVLRGLYADLALTRADVAFHHLDLSEEHYLAARWDDTISNSRKFLECVLQEVSATHSEKITGTVLDQELKDAPVRVRDYLEKSGLLESKEKEALAKVYGLLSHTGGHPYMAQNDQARLLRHLALTFSQFVLLRLRGKLSA